MACQTNANQGVGAAIKCGISGMASKAGYVGGVAAGAALGGLAGSSLGPLGTAGGAILGGRGAAYLMKKRQLAKADQAKEAAWQQSETGRKAVTTRDRALAKAQQDYQTAVSPLKARVSKIKADYEAVKEAGVEKLKQEPGSGSLKDFVASPKTRAAVAGAAQVGLAVLGTVLADARDQVATDERGRPRPPVRVVKTAGLSAIQQVRGYGERVQTAYEQTWQKTPEGQAASRKYQAELLKAQEKTAMIKRNYALQQDAIKTKYSQARDEFLREQG